MANVWTQLTGLLAGPRLWIGQVTAFNADGTSTVLARGGVSLKVYGQSTPVGQTVFVQDGRILGPAPNLPYFELTV